MDPKTGLGTRIGETSLFLPGNKPRLLGRPEGSVVPVPNTSTLDPRLVKFIPQHNLKSVTDIRNVAS